MNAINMEKVSEAHVAAAIQKFSLSDKGTLEQRVRRLQKHQEAEVPGEKRAACDVCGGVSNVDLPACPFCGDESVEQHAGNGAGGTPAGEVVDGGTAEVVHGANGKAPPKGLKKVKGKAMEGRPSIDPSSAPELDRAVGAVREAQLAGVNSYWDLGRALLDIFTPQLWKQRVSEDGKPLFRSFNQFCDQELGISHSQAYQIMQCAEHFSREQFLTVGQDKLVQILKIAPEKRTALLKAAKEGKVTREQLREMVAREPQPVRTGQSHGGGHLKATEAAREKRRQARAQKDGEVTAVSALGRVKVPLFARPKGGKKDDPKRAVALHQDPWGTEQLANDVECTYRVVKESRGLVLVIERRRKSGA